MTVLAFLAVVAGLMLIGYQRIVPETWFRDFVAEINARATVVPGPPSGSAFPTMRHRPDPDHPYICFTQFPPMAWDRLYVLAPLTDIGADPTYAALDWQGDRWADLTDAQRTDDSHVLFVLTDGAAVVDVHPFFVVWGDAQGLVRDGGYSRTEAVFTAESRGVQFNLAPANEVPDGICNP